MTEPSHINSKKLLLEHGNENTFQVHSVHYFLNSYLFILVARFD